MATLMNDLGAILTPDVLRRLGGAIGENPNNAVQADSVGLPALLDALRERFASATGASEMMRIIHEQHYDEPEVLGRITDVAGDPTRAASLAPEGNGVLHRIFGDRLDDLTTRLGATTGVGQNAMRGMLAMLTPMVLGVIGNRARKDNLGGNQVAALLSSHRSLTDVFTSGQVPVDVSGAAVPSAPSMNPPAQMTTTPTSRAHRSEGGAIGGDYRTARDWPRETPRNEHGVSMGRTGSMSWVGPMLGLLVLALVLFFLFRGTTRDEPRPIDERPTTSESTGLSRTR